MKTTNWTQVMEIERSTNWATCKIKESADCTFVVNAEGKFIDHPHNQFETFDAAKDWLEEMKQKK
jgi:hypothetical protein